MHIIFLKFTAKKDQAAQYMDGHKEWLQKGFSDGVFLLAGSLKPGLGGGILAYNCSFAELQTRVGADPFVAKGVVRPEIFEIDSRRADERLQFLVA